MGNEKRSKNRLRLKDDELKLIQEYRGIKDASDKHDINDADVDHGWLKSKHASVHFRNPNFQQDKFDPDLIDWKYICKGLKFNKIEPCLTGGTGLFDRLVITDAHIGMNPNIDGHSQYGGRWDEEDIWEAFDIIIETIKNRSNSNTLIIDELGDFLDGWNGQTVRRQHELPQTIKNPDAFDIALKFKLELARYAASINEHVIINNICNDNHAGNFGYILNSAFKTAIELICPNVKVTNHMKFINHYSFGLNTFILSHGKDKETLKFGFKPFLDKPQMEKIDNYIDEHFLLQPDVKIEFSKGDSHQYLFDGSTSQRFNYYNYPAFSPSSNWIQTNYKKGKSGFVFFNYLSTDDIVQHNKWFKWKK